LRWRRVNVICDMFWMDGWAFRLLCDFLGGEVWNCVFGWLFIVGGI